MKSDQFKSALLENVEKRRPKGYSAEWSRDMYKIIEEIGKQYGFKVRHKYKGGEINHLDFCYIGASKDSIASPPSVIIEHENAWSEKETQKDFWKLCLYAIPLRVMFGYQSSSKGAKNVGESLIQFYNENGLRQAEFSETLLIMGWDQDTKNRKWHSWTLKGKGNSWKYEILR